MRVIKVRGRRRAVLRHDEIGAPPGERRFPAQQAGNVSEGITRSHLVPRHKRRSLAEVAKLEVRWTIVMWAVGINVALTVAILGVLLRASGHVS